MARVFLLTGATGSIGGQIAAKLAAQPGVHLILACRSAERGAAVAGALKLGAGSACSVELFDLSAPQHAPAFAQRIRDEYKRLDVLVNNAACVPKTKQVATVGGKKIDLQFTVNVLSYYALMTAFADLLAESAAANGGGGVASRIVNVASNYAGGLVLDDLSFDARNYEANSAYRQSKQADRMLTAVAAELLGPRGVTVNACHPGVVTSTLLRDLGMASGWDSAAKGAATPAFLACDPSCEGASGKYWQDCEQKPCPFARDTAGCRALWAACAQMLAAE